MRIQQHQPNTPNLKSPLPNKPAGLPVPLERATLSSELSDVQLAKIILPRLTIPVAVGMGAGALVSSLPSVMEVAAPGAGYLAAGLLGVGTVGALSAGASVGPGAGILMGGAMGFAAIACFNNAPAVGQVLLSPPAMGMVGGFVGLAAVVFHVLSRPQK